MWTQSHYRGLSYLVVSVPFSIYSVTQLVFTKNKFNLGISGYTVLSFTGFETY